MLRYCKTIVLSCINGSAHHCKVCSWPTDEQLALHVIQIVADTLYHMIASHHDPEHIC